MFLISPYAAPRNSATLPAHEGGQHESTKQRLSVLWLQYAVRGQTRLTREDPSMIRADILQKFPDLFGTKRVNGREVDVEQTIATLTRELDPEIAAALDVSPDRPGPDRQLPRTRHEVALAAQRRSSHPRARPPVANPRTRAHRPVASAGHGVQCPQQPGAPEHAGLRGRLAAALPADGTPSNEPVGV